MLTIARDLAWIATRCVAGIAAMVALAAVLSGCNPCFYRWDGRTAPDRAFYKLCIENGKEVVKCDSPNRLPNKDCK